MGKPLFLSVRNYEKYQHYKDRNPPWVKIYWNLLSDDKFVMLPLSDRGLYCLLILLASRHDNYIPNDSIYIQLQLKLTEPPDLTRLINSGFLLARYKRAASKTLDLGSAPKREREKREQRVEEQSSEKEEEKKEEEEKMARSDKPTRAQRQTDEEWIQGLKSDSTYRHVDVGFEQGKCQRWCIEHHKQFTRRRFINWLNRVEKPMAVGMVPTKPKRFSPTADAMAKICELEAQRGGT